MVIVIGLCVLWLFLLFLSILLYSPPPQQRSQHTQLTALARGPANKLEVLLCNLQVLTRVLLLSKRRIHNALENILLRGRRLEVLDQPIGLFQVALTQEVDDEVEARLGDDVNQLREDLEGALAVAEDDL